MHNRSVIIVPSEVFIGSYCLFVILIQIFWIRILRIENHPIITVMSRMFMIKPERMGKFMGNYSKLKICKKFIVYANFDVLHKHNRLGPNSVVALPDWDICQACSNNHRHKQP